METLSREVNVITQIVAPHCCVLNDDIEYALMRLFWSWTEMIKNGFIPKGSTKEEKGNYLIAATYKEMIELYQAGCLPSKNCYASYTLLITTISEAKRVASPDFSFEGQPAILKALNALMGSDIIKFNKQIFPQEASYDELIHIRENLVVKVEALCLEVKKMVHREHGFEGSQPKFSEIVAIILQRENKPYLLHFVYTVLRLMIGFLAVEKVMGIHDGSAAGDTAAPDNTSVDAAVAPVISSAVDAVVTPVISAADDAVAPDNSSVDAVAEPVISSTGDAAVPDSLSVDAAVAPVISSTGDAAAPDSLSVDAAVAPVIFSADDAAAPDSLSVDAAVAPVISSADDAAAPDSLSVDAVAEPVISSAGDAAAPDNSSVDTAAAPVTLEDEEWPEFDSKPFSYDLYLYVGYKNGLIQKDDYLALRSREIRHHFTEDLGKSVVLLSYAYRSCFQDNLAKVLSYINVNLPEHNAMKYIKDFVSMFSTNDVDDVYEYMVLLSFISEVTMEIYRKNKETDPLKGYLNEACKYFHGCGMLNFWEMLKKDNFVTLHNFANQLAKSWEPMEDLLEATQILRMNNFVGVEIEERSGPEGQEDESLDAVARPKDEGRASGKESGALSELKDEGETRKPDAEGVKDDDSREPGEDGPASEEEDDESEAQLEGAVGERSNPEGKEDVKGWKPKQPKGKKKKKNKKQKGRR